MIQKVAENFVALIERRELGGTSTASSFFFPFSVSPGPRPAVDRIVIVLQVYAPPAGIDSADDPIVKTAESAFDCECSVQPGMQRLKYG